VVDLSFNFFAYVYFVVNRLIDRLLILIYLLFVGLLSRDQVIFCKTYCFEVLFNECLSLLLMAL
jgi:hypothetical protein